MQIWLKILYITELLWQKICTLVIFCAADRSGGFDFLHFRRYLI